MTRMPVIVSRRRVFMLSMNPWSTRKIGALTLTAMTMTTPMTRVMARRSQPMT